MKNQLLLFATGILAVLLLLEAIFRLLPVSTATRSGYHIHPLIITYPAHHCLTAATGWDLKNSQHSCANNYGFLTDRDFVQDPQAIALIGDSFVEANMLPAHQRLDAQLETRLAGRPVYALGGPGSNLLDYAERAKFAADRFGIRTFVFILERGDVKQAICGSGNIHGPCLDAITLLPRTEIQRPPNALKRVVRESALAQYLFSQIRFDITKVLFNPLQPTATPSNPLRQDLSLSASTHVVSQFIRQISTIEGARFMFLIDADRAHLSDTLTREGDDLKTLKSAADAIRAVVIDPTEAFRASVADSGRALEVGPYDHHWNANTVQIVAESIAKRLPQLEVKD